MSGRLTQTQIVRYGRRDRNRKPNVVKVKTVDKIRAAYRRLCGDWSWRKKA